MDAGSTSVFINILNLLNRGYSIFSEGNWSVRNLRTISILQTSRSFQPPGPSRKIRSDSLACDLRSDVKAKLVRVNMICQNYEMLEICLFSVEV